MVGQHNVNNEVNSVRVHAACSNRSGCFPLQSWLAVGFMALLLPSMASGAATFVQVNSNSTARYTNSVAVAFTAPSGKSHARSQTTMGA